MACHLHPIETDQCVCLTFWRNATGAETESAFQSMNALLCTRQWNRAVVDITRWHSEPTALELFEFAEHLCFETPRGVCIAVLVRLEQARRARLVAHVARNRGVVLDCFADARNATVWMKSGPT